jgi:probable lipoprotein NlpC
MSSWWNNYVGIPYKDGGRDRTGCDCAGLVCLIYKEQLGIDVDHDFGFYDPADRTHSVELLDDLSKDWQEVQEPRDFDVVRLRVFSDPCHLGIIVNGGNHILNIRKGVRAVIEPLNRRPWSTRIDSYWRQK